MHNKWKRLEKMEIEQWNEMKFQRWKQTGKDLGNMFQWKGKLQNWKRSEQDGNCHTPLWESL